MVHKNKHNGIFRLPDFGNKLIISSWQDSFHLYFIAGAKRILDLSMAKYPLDRYIVHKKGMYGPCISKHLITKPALNLGIYG